MTVSYQYDSKAKVIFVDPGKVVCLEDIQSYFDQILKDDTIQPGFVEVVDFESIEEFKLTATEAVIVGKLIQQLVDQKQDNGIVFLAKSELQFGMARMLSVIMEGILPIRIVRSERDAMIEAMKIHGNSITMPSAEHQ